MTLFFVLVTRKINNIELITHGNLIMKNIRFKTSDNSKLTLTMKIFPTY